MSDSERKAQCEDETPTCVMASANQSGRSGQRSDGTLTSRLNALSADAMILDELIIELAIAR